MSEDNKARDVVDAVTGLAKAVPIYQDVAQPAAQEVGKALQTVAKTVHIALAPVSALVWGYDQIKDFVSTRVTERLRNVAPENIISPKPNVAGPALEALRYIGHESSLSDLYANLLAASMDKSTATGAHPAFVEIIKQLTPDEAKIVRLFLVPRGFPIVDVRWMYRPSVNGKVGGQSVISNYSHIGRWAECELLDMTPTYLDNLCRLGLAEMPVMFTYTSAGAYDALEHDPVVTAAVAAFEQDPERIGQIERKGLKVTQMGSLFAEVCVREKS